jgi:hypothetical protein
VGGENKAHTAIAAHVKYAAVAHPSRQRSVLSSRAAAIQHKHQHGKMSLVGWVGGENMVQLLHENRSQMPQLQL